MYDQTYQEISRVPRSKGVLGQDIFFIKNKNQIWSLQNTENKLWGRCSFNLGQTWQDWQELVSNYDGYFSFTIDEENILHIVCKNSRGSLVYLFWQKDEFSIDILGENYLEDDRLTYQTILVNKEGHINLIYFTEDINQEMWRIKHCVKENGQWSLPEIIDLGRGQGQNQGAVALGFDGTIHLVYQIKQKNIYQFVHVEHDLKTESWSNKVAITSSNKSNLYPSLVIDEKGTLHLTWIRSDGMNYRIMYRRKTRGGWMVGGWQQDRILSLPGVNAYTPTIGILDDKIICIWQQTEGIFQSISLDEGQSFSEPILLEKYHKLAYKNLISMDFYKKEGLNIMKTFDTGSTSVALLATVFSNEEEENSQEVLNLPELKEKQELILPNIEYLNIDYGQKGIEKHLKKINGNFQRLLFETEDIRLTNLQMQDTLKEKKETIEDLYLKITDKKQQIESLVENEKTLEQVITKLKGSILRKNKDYQEKQSILNKKIKELEENLAKYQIKLQSSEALNTTLRKQLEEKDLIISELISKEKTLKIELEELKNTSLWKKIFKIN